MEFTVEEKIIIEDIDSTIKKEVRRLTLMSNAADRSSLTKIVSNLIESKKNYIETIKLMKG